MGEGQDQRNPRVPEYVLRWQGLRVSWGQRGPGQIGRVTSVQQLPGEDGPWVSLRVLADSGFLVVGVNAQTVNVEDETE